MARSRTGTSYFPSKFFKGQFGQVKGPHGETKEKAQPCSRSNYFRNLDNYSRVIYRLESMDPPLSKNNTRYLNKIVAATNERTTVPECLPDSRPHLFPIFTKHFVHDSRSSSNYPGVYLEECTGDVSHPELFMFGLEEYTGNNVENKSRCAGCTINIRILSAEILRIPTNLNLMCIQHILITVNVTKPLRNNTNH